MNIVKNLKINCSYLLFCTLENKSTYKIRKCTSGRTGNTCLKLSSFSAPCLRPFITPTPFSVLHLLCGPWEADFYRRHHDFPLTLLGVTNEETGWETGGQRRTKLACFPITPFLSGPNWRWLCFLFCFVF